MKKKILILCLLFLIGGCSTVPEESTCPAVGFSDCYRLNSADEIPNTVMHVSWSNVWDGLYPIRDNSDVWPNYIVVECNVEHIFYMTTPEIANEREKWMTEGEPCYLWISLPHRDRLEEDRENFCEMLHEIDSFIVYGHMATPRFALSGEFGTRIGNEYLLENKESNTWLAILPSVRIDALYEWPIIPIDDDVVSADIMETFVTQMYGGNGIMSFSIDKVDAEHGLYFRNGCSTEELYDALNMYVDEYSPS